VTRKQINFESTVILMDFGFVSQPTIILTCCYFDRPDGTKSWYIGLMKNASTANATDYWLDGSNSTLRVYKPGEPDKAANMCFVIRADPDVKMADKDCALYHRFICKVTVTGGKALV